MKSENLIRISFFVRTSQMKEEDSNAPIYCRIAVNGRRKDFSTKQYVAIRCWDKNKQRLKGNTEEALRINKYLEGIRNDLLRAWDKLREEKETITIDEVLNIFKGKGETTMGVVEFLKQYNDKLYKTIGS